MPGVREERHATPAETVPDTGPHHRAILGAIGIRIVNDRLWWNALLLGDLTHHRRFRRRVGADTTTDQQETRVCLFPDAHTLHDPRSQLWRGIPPRKDRATEYHNRVRGRGVVDSRFSRDFRPGDR